MRPIIHPTAALVCILPLAACRGPVKDDTGTDQSCWDSLVISEVMYEPDAVAADDGEYFEVYNGGGSGCDLQGLSLSRNGSQNHTIGEPVTVAAGAYAVLAKGEALGDVIAVDYVYGGSISLTDETRLCLQEGDDEDKIEFDCVSYDTTWELPARGHSLSLDPEHLDATENDDMENWCQSDAELGNGDFGSPGEDGDTCETPPPPACWQELVISEIMHDPSALADGDGEYLEVYNGSVDACPLLGAVVSRTGSGSHVIAEELVVAAGDYAVLAKSDVLGTVVEVDYVYGTSITLTSETEICLLGSDGVVLDCVAYGGTGWDMPSSGTSLSLDPELQDAELNDDPGSWCPSSEDMGNGDLGTPGVANAACPQHPTLSPGDAFITELMPKPDPELGAAHGEYVEAFNVGDEDIPLAYLKLEDGGSAKTLTCVGTTWAAGTVLVIARDADTNTNGGIPADCEAGFALNDTGDTFALLYTQPNGDEDALDTVTYTGDWPFSTAVAMELLSGSCFSATGNDDSACWAAATSVFGTAGHYGTPGTAP